MERIVARRKTAYCPTYGQMRTIYVEIFRHPALADDFFDIGEFECDDKEDCEFAHNVPFCPFLLEVLRPLRR